jgi:hypothetical protein
VADTAAGEIWKNKSVGTTKWSIGLENILEQCLIVIFYLSI